MTESRPVETVFVQPLLNLVQFLFFPVLPRATLPTTRLHLSRRRQELRVRGGLSNNFFSSVLPDIVLNWERLGFSGRMVIVIIPDVIQPQLITQLVSRPTR